MAYSEPWNRYSEPWNIENCGIFRTLLYSEYWYIQNPGIFTTLTYLEPWYIQSPVIFRTLAYSEPWYRENPGIFRTRAIFSTMVYSRSQAYSQPCETSAIECFTKIMKILYIFKYGNCDLSETGRIKVELVFNIRKLNHFHKKSVFSWRKAACPQK